MKRWLILSGTALVAVGLLALTVRDLVESVRYFASEPRNLLDIVAIGLLGGFTAFVFDRLSPRIQSRFRIIAWGAAAGAATLMVGYIGFGMASLFPLPLGSSEAAAVCLVMLSSSLSLVWLWFEFYQAWKTGGARRSGVPTSQRDASP